jgi:hypothetical protein
VQFLGSALSKTQFYLIFNLIQGTAKRTIWLSTIVDYGHHRGGNLMFDDDE